jgi:hypothetical protein
MKTPREILFEKHRSAEPKLDTVRRQALNIVANEKQHARRKRKIFNWPAIPSLFWRELILPYRRIWAGIAAAWILIFALNLASRDNSPTVVGVSPPPSPEMLIALENQKRLFAEMLVDSPKANDTDRPKPSRPSPHSELILPIVTA